MYTHFTFADGSNPYIATSSAKLFDMIKKYDMDQTGENSFEVFAPIVFYTVHTGRKMSAYTKAQAALRDFAQRWQGAAHMFCYSWGELCDWAGFFEEYGKKYGLLREFRESGLC